jgi:hypothetical protein
LTRASIKKHESMLSMDCRVKPGNDDVTAIAAEMG